MNDAMLEHRETEEHLKQLEQRGCTVVAPVVGRLASGKVARGRLAAPERIVAVVDAVVSRRRNLQGIRVVVSAGGTREPIDPVRYLGNYSSGKMGRALAEVASARGAEVTLVTTVSEEMEGIDVVHVSTAEEMLAALKRVSGAADVLVMAAAVADFKPATVASAKIHRNAALKSVELQPTSDVLGGLGGRPGLFRVAFAAETEDLAQRAAEKLKSKGTDLLVANLIGKDGQGLGSDYNAALVLGPNGPVDDIPRLPKEEVAKRIWDAIVSGRASRG
jgi:phosphopantothenoylcysteine decarboxylase/phosphopantothenate--cysteine ligase